MAKGNDSKTKKASTKKKSGKETAPADASSQPKVSADVCKEPAPTVNDAEPLWDIVCVLSKEADKKCRAEGCNDSAVATWASNVDPEDTWDLCDQCQTNDFGGWPEGFHPDERASENGKSPAIGSGNEQGSTDGRSEDSTQMVSDASENEVLVNEDGAPDKDTADAGKSTTTSPNDQESIEEDPSLEKETPNKEDMSSSLSTSQNDGDKSDCADESSKDRGASQEAVEVEEDEIWDLKKILSLFEVSKECPIKCSTPDCPLAACSVWVSRHKPNEKWYSCIDCQETDFEGWPTEDLPITHMATDHKRVLAEKCSTQKSPAFPEFSGHEGTSPVRENGDSKTTAHTITPVPSSVHSNATQAQKKGVDSTVTPSPAVATAARPTQQSKNLLKAHRKWQEQAEAMGGPDARIIVSKPVAKKLIFETLHDAFRPMNITQIHKELKAVVPSPILKSCLDEMTDSTDDGNPFADSDSDDDEKPTKKKKKASSDDIPYSGSLSFKAGRNANSCLYFVDYTKLKNNGNGLEPEERNALAADMAKAEEEEVVMKEKLKQITSETAQLLSEPTNEAAATALETEEEETTDLMEKLEAARKLKVNEKHKMQVKKRIASMTAQWRKRKRMCLDFLIAMEESTEGTVSMKKCLAGDGQIELDSDEVAIAGAIAFAQRKKMKTTSSAKKALKIHSKNPVAARGGKSAATSTTGIPPSASFVGVRLDSRGNVCRVHIDGDKEVPDPRQNKPKPRVSYC